MDKLVVKISTWGQALLRPVDASSVATFRLLFGLIMIGHVIGHFRGDYIGEYYIRPTFHFTYAFFESVTPWPGNGMYIHFFIMGILALGITLGLLYRLSTFLFLLAFSYVFLLEKSLYQNHYYLIILVAFLLIFTDAHRWASLDSWRDPRLKTSQVPFWNIFILRAQFFIVYFYAGVAKINHDWLRGEPMRFWLKERSHYPVLGPYFTEEWVVYFFSYGGLFFDLLIGFLLLWRRTRVLAFVGVVFFNLMNGWLFSIDIFPYMAIAATVLFAEPDWPRHFASRLGRLFQRLKISIPSPGARPLDTNRAINRPPWPVLTFVTLYLVIQMVVPLRHWLYPGNVSWIEEGHFFSWRMRLNAKWGFLWIRAINPKTGEMLDVNPTQDLKVWQFLRMVTRPDMILQYVHFLRRRIEAAGISNPIINIDARVSLNGRPYHPFTDPDVNLAEVRHRPFTHATWILPAPK